MNTRPHAKDDHNLPTARQLIMAWVLLMALTVGTMIAGRVTSAASLGLAWTALLMVITWAKARTILMVYLNLRVAPAHWKSGFSATLVFVLLLILGIYALEALGLVIHHK
ncbi:cytochrome C oxidase subunit IV family protein [Thermopetrobacter sp. TC1]|uniref:cytochrome C oxidase subunit IV family protein n=1 Tax=Thermopetrobacter sp. TC1 TaxID=1495045 RepID=UPI00056FC5F8|nr:cytochrome C oxidase subunit IV family protein [Thermopetrobacter sp. TC1]